MKKILVLFICSFLATLHAGTFKKYCSEDDIEVSGGKIMIHSTDGSLESSALFSDEQGLYYYDHLTIDLSSHKPLNPKNTCEFNGVLCSQEK